MPTIVSKSTQLPEEIGMYVDGLRKACPAIEEVWLVGPRVNEPEHRGSDWELVAFADRRVLDAVRADRSWQRPDVSLLVVVDGDRYEKAWGGSESGSLSRLDWRLEDPHTATYVDGGAARRDGTDAARRRSSAVRVR